MEYTGTFIPGLRLLSLSVLHEPRSNEYFESRTSERDGGRLCSTITTILVTYGEWKEHQ